MYACMHVNTSILVVLLFDKPGGNYPSLGGTVRGEYVRWESVHCSQGFLLTHFTLASKLLFLAVQGSGALLSIVTLKRLGMYRLSIRYPVSAGYLTIRHYSEPVK